MDSISDLNQKHALEVQIMEFGQIPKQVFKVPHPQRKVGLDILKEPNQIKGDETNMEGRYYLLLIHLYSLEFNYLSHQSIS